MATRYILHNPGAGTIVDGQVLVERVSDPNKQNELMKITEIGDYQSFFSKLQPEDDIVVCGGDGTLNRFVNDTAGIAVENQILYYPSGTGNDFAKDVGKTEKDPPFSVSEYINELPMVTVNGKDYRFINGIGYGIDGYCCEIGDQLKQANKKVNYTTIALKGLFYDYHPTGATVTVDGVARSYKKVWMVPTMNGRYFGGGMMATPNQDRCGADKTLSIMVVHDSSRFRTLTFFPGIFKGVHIKHTDIIEIFTGHEVTVTFDRPTALQIDGETILDVTTYTAKSVKALAQEKDSVAEKETVSV